MELAFRKPWRDWAWASRFPMVRASVHRDDVVRILGKSARRQGSIVALWEMSGPWFEPLLRHDGDVEEAGDHMAEWIGVPLEGWVQLAQAFVDRLGDGSVQRSGRS